MMEVQQQQSLLVKVKKNRTGKMLGDSRIMRLILNMSQSLRVNRGCYL